MLTKKVAKQRRCLYCGEMFIVKHPSQKFCSHKGRGNCKDSYHNETNPRGIFASYNNYDPEDECHEGWDDHKGSW